MSLEGKIAVITGGNRGIGRAVALRLANEKAHIIITGRSADDNAVVEKEINAKHPGAVQSFVIDAADAAAVAAFGKTIKKEFAKIDILVNNAGICHLSQNFADLPEELWQETFAVNLYGVVRFTRVCIPFFKAQRSGKIVQIASLAGEIGGIATAADYVASKAAILGLTKSLARELGSYNINVNAVAPGFVRTQMTQKMKIVLENIPLRRIAEPEDIANAVAFLVSEEARCITGTTLDVNGGLYMK
jgi:NAD(P)-dependent dehydrogenase (short-subunit alcohol dehydrogenase family)